ncbi:hypothetical protein Q9189_008237, partial [Teloschistes chrysophthalmus]
MTGSMDVEEPIKSFSSTVQDEESDWEYEYDETATESFYVTIDCSSNSHQTRAPKKPNTPPKDADSAPAEQKQQEDQEQEYEEDEESDRDNSPTKQDQQNPASSQGTSAIDPALLVEDSDLIVEDPDLDDTLFPSSPTTQQPPKPDPTTRIQILDLHTSNPLISYNAQLHTCTWASTIGTDVFLAAPSTLPSLPTNNHPTNNPANNIPLQTYPNASILTTSCIKLTARPITIAPKAEKNPHPAPPPSSDTTPTTTIEPLKIPLAPTAKLHQRNQASFLEKLIALKASKGEPDDVTVFSRAANQGTGWRARRNFPPANPPTNTNPNDDGESDADTNNNDEEEEVPVVQKSPTPSSLHPPNPSNPSNIPFPFPPNFPLPSNPTDTDTPPPKRPRGRNGGRPRGRGRIGRPRGSRGGRASVVGLFKGEVGRGQGGVQGGVDGGVEEGAEVEMEGRVEGGGATP